MTALPSTSIASGVAIQFNNLSSPVSDFEFPQRIAVLAQPRDAFPGVVYNERKTIQNARQAGDLFGFGSPIHMCAVVLYNNFNSVGSIPVDVYPIDSILGAVASTGSIDLVGTQNTTQTYTLSIASQQITFTLVAGTTATNAAIFLKQLIDNNINLAVTSGVIALNSIPLTANWSDLTSNDIRIKLDGTEDGITFVINNMTGGLGTPDVTDALANFTGVWETLAVTQFSDSANLTSINARGEELWDPTVSMPFYCFYGSIETDPATVIIDTELRKNERVLSKFPVPGSNSSTWEIASSIAARVGNTAEENPPVPYVGSRIYGILPGSSNVQWDYEKRNIVELGGCSTSYLDEFGAIKVGDVLTTYHPLGEPNPGYRYVVDVVKSQFILGDLRFLFNSPNFQQVILVPTLENVSNPRARDPAGIKTACFGLIDDWVADAIIVNGDDAKANLIVVIDSLNSNRVNITFGKATYSQALRITDITFDFTTNFGS
jgi:phage tail sheath gpL-like